MHFRNIGWQFIYPDMMMKIRATHTVITIWVTGCCVDWNIFNCSL